MPTAIAPVSLRAARSEGAGEPTRRRVSAAHARPAQPLVKASVAPADLQRARAGWRRTVSARWSSRPGVTLLLLIGPLLDARAARAIRAPSCWRPRGGEPAARRRGAAAIWLRTRVVGRRAVAALHRSTCCSARRRCGRAGRAAGRRRCTRLHTAAPRARRAAARRSVGALSRCNLLGRRRSSPRLILAFARVLRSRVDPATVDLRHFSLHPWNGAALLLARRHAARCTSRCCGRRAGPGRRASARWRLPRAGSAAADARCALWLAADRCVAAVPRRRRRGGRCRCRARPVGGRLRRRGARSRRGWSRLVPARDRRGPDPRAVPRVPGAGAAALSVGQLLRRASPCGG